MAQYANVTDLTIVSHNSEPHVSGHERSNEK